MIVKYTQEEYDLAKSTGKLPLQCERCGKIFYAEKKAIKFESNHNRGRLKYCSIECSDKAHHTEHHLHCENCGKDIVVLDCTYRKSKTKHFFCSSSCAAIFNNKKRKSPSEETRKKTSESLIAYHKNKSGNDYVRIKKDNNTPKQYIRKYHVCHICNKKYFLSDNGATRKFCSKECSQEYKNNTKKYLSDETIAKLSESGRRSVFIQAENKRSKNEKYFCKLCEQHFKNVKHNEPVFNGWDADVIIDDIKVAVLWNGKWHYEKIKENHSVEQVQNRDRIKIKEIENCGYKPYIIKDMGKYNPQFVENEFQKFINIAGE